MSDEEVKKLVPDKFVTWLFTYFKTVLKFDPEDSDEITRNICDVLEEMIKEKILEQEAMEFDRLFKFQKASTAPKIAVNKSRQMGSSAVNFPEMLIDDFYKVFKINNDKKK
jgi:hypothetical protein